MRGRTWSRVVGSLMLVGWICAWPQPAAAQAPTAVLDRVAITAGDELTVRVSGFGGKDELVTWVESARGSVYPTRGGATDTTGNATITIATRSFWEAGWWVLVVKSWRGERLATANFEVIAAPPTDTLQVSPTTARPGTRVYFYGYGFMPADLVSVWVTRPDQSTEALPGMIVDRTRQIAFVYDVPAGAMAGQYSMTAYGRRSDRLLVGTFIVER